MGERRARLRTLLHSHTFLVSKQKICRIHICISYSKFMATDKKNQTFKKWSKEVRTLESICVVLTLPFDVNMQGEQEN